MVKLLPWVTGQLHNLPTYFRSDIKTGSDIKQFKGLYLIQSGIESMIFHTNGVHAKGFSRKKYPVGSERH
jgi:hypothetical protein